MTYQPRTETGTPLDSAIEELGVIAEQFPAHKSYVEVVQGSLTRIRDRHAEGDMTVEAASQELFDVYAWHQDAAQNVGQMAGILRVVGDDFGTQLGVDPDTLWAIYERSIDR